MSRPSKDEFFLELADAYSCRATCPRASIGAVFVVNNRAVAMGYNGAAEGLEHCEDVGCDVIDTHCQRAVHAEINAICQAARTGVSLFGATAYLTNFPCWHCMKTMINVGIRRVVYSEAYRNDPRVISACKTLGIELLHLG